MTVVMKMADFITSTDYRFARTHDKRARGALGRVNRFLKNMLQAIADSRMRRLERELELRGYRYGRPNNDWASCNSTRLMPPKSD
jgi:hypothetical protein